MKKVKIFIPAILLFAAFSFSGYAQTENRANSYMSAAGTLSANFTYSQLIEAGRLELYTDSETGYTAEVYVESGDENACTACFEFRDGDAFFGFKTDFDLIDGKPQLTAVHSKAATLPHRKLADMEFSSVPYNEITYSEITDTYCIAVGYVTEIREFTRKGIMGQGVSLYLYSDGDIVISRDVLDTATEGGYDARSGKEIIGSHSREIIIAVIIIGWLLLKNVSMENVAKNSAELANKKEN